SCTLPRGGCCSLSRWRRLPVSPGWPSRLNGEFSLGGRERSRPMRDYRKYLPALVFLLGCGFVWNAHSQDAIPLAAPLQTIAPSFSGYDSQEQQVSAEERRIAGMNDYVARVF